jgi:hypothetical protein
MKNKLKLVYITTPIALILFQLVYSKKVFLPGIQPERYFNSDSLALLDYSKSLFQEINFYDQWYWGTHWFIFPDLLTLKVLEILGLNEYRTLLGFGILSYLIIQYVALKVFSYTNMPIWITIIGIAGLLDVTPFQDIWYPGFYFSAIAIAVWIYYLHNFKSVKTSITISLCALLSFSHQIYGVVIMLLTLVSLVVIYVCQEFDQVIKFVKHNFLQLITCGIFTYVGEKTLYNRYTINWGVTELNSRSIALLEFFKENLLNKVSILGSAASLLACIILLSGSIKKIYNFEYITLIISIFLSSLVLTFLSLFAAGTEWLPRYASGLLMFSFLPIFVILSLKSSGANYAKS